jgi:hypothetical protein
MRRRRMPQFQAPPPPIPAEQIPTGVVSQVKFALSIGMPGQPFADLVHSLAGGQEYTKRYSRPEAIAELTTAFEPHLPGTPRQVIESFAAQFVQRCKELNP